MTGRPGLDAVVGYRFSRPRLLEQALTHRSHGEPHNERLEFLGDSILGFIVAEHLYERFQDVSEGLLTRMRARVVRGETLAASARTIPLGPRLILGQGARNSGDDDRDSILANALEAVIGAIYLDGGLEPARAFVTKTLAMPLAELRADGLSKDSKTSLQEWLQQRGRELPSYRVVDETGPPHARRFVIECQPGGQAVGYYGEGDNRRTAEQRAAYCALQALRDGK